MKHCSFGLLSLLLNILATTECSVKLSGQIVKPKKDKREYRGLTLENGIKTVLISDPATDKAAAALSVHVGYLSDPKEIPGMAHFCEHMLFMGTKKFPEESYYQKFLTTHGGLYNAGTAYDWTTYYFDIAADYLDQTLDVFSQFFVAPLFSASTVDRETNAVNSEYYLKIRQDGRRIESVYAAISDPGHDFTKFGVGSRETLYDIPKSKETLVKNLIKQITTFKVNPTRFNNLHKALVRELKNFNVKPGLDQAIALFSELTSQNDWSAEQMVKTADDVTPARLEDYLKMLLSQLHIDVFGSGNYERKDVLAIAKVVDEAFKKDTGTVPLEPAAVERSRRINLYREENALFQKVHPVDFNTALFDYFECDVSNLRNDLLAGLLGQIIHQPMFEQLRTVEQLGYQVEGAGMELEGLTGFVGLISSGRSPDFLEQRFDSFLTDLAAGLTNITEKEFDNEKEALATKRFEKPKQLEAKSAQFWKEIWQGLYNFDRKELEKPILKKITLKDFIDLFDKCINPKSDKRRRLNVWIVGTKARATGYQPDSACNDKAKCVSDPTEFVKQHPLAPRPKPFQTLKEIEAKCPRNCRSPGE